MATFAISASDTARIFVYIHESDHPAWQVAKSNPKQAIRLWMDQIDKEDDGALTDANMTAVGIRNNYIEATIYANRPERILQSSGKDGIYAKAPKSEKRPRDTYTVVRAPPNMTIAQMLKACDDSTQGLVRNAIGKFWRVKKDQGEKLRAKMDLGSGGPRRVLFEVGPIPTPVLGG